MKIDNTIKIALLSVAMAMSVYAWVAYMIIESYQVTLILLSTFFVPILLYFLILYTNKLINKVLQGLHSLINKLALNSKVPLVSSLDEGDLNLISSVTTILLLSFLLFTLFVSAT